MLTSFPFAPTPPGTESAAGATFAKWLTDNVQMPMFFLGGVMIMICLIYAGITIAAKSGSGDGIRQGIASIGMILLGGIIVGGAAVLGALMIKIGGGFVDNAPAGKGGGSGSTTLANWLAANVQLPLFTVGTVIVVIVLMWAGIRIMLKSRSSDGIRQAISSLGVVFVSAVVIGASAVIGSLLISVGSNWTL